MDKKCPPINKKSPFVYNWSFFALFVLGKKESKKLVPKAFPAILLI
jgi:hypothetical protein